MNISPLTLITSAFLVGFVGYRTLSKNTDIVFNKIDKENEKHKKLMYDIQLDKLARDLVDDIIKNVCIELDNEYETNSISYDICSICSTCSSFIEVVEVDS